MSYLVLARKWRPSTFDELIGQEHVVTTISNAIKSNRVHHAYIFTGSRGVGKTSAARILAKSLNCENGPTANPCGQCNNCVEISQGTATDVYEIDGASNTSVDNIRELRENVRYLPSRTRYKIYIIDEVHMLSTSAFNALLKTLEEPPEHVKFIFATTEPQKIPITILSRCQRFDFRRVNPIELFQRLKTITEKENIAIEDNAIRIIVREAQGSVRDAQSLLEQAIAFCDEHITEQGVIEAIGVVDRLYVTQAAQAIIQKNIALALDAAQVVFSRGYDLVEYLSLINEFIRDTSVIKTGVDSSYLERSESEVELITDLAREMSFVDLQRIFKIITQASIDMKMAPIPKLILDMAILKACEISPSHDLAEIISALQNDTPIKHIAAPKEPQQAVKKQAQPITSKKTEKYQPSQVVMQAPKSNNREEIERESADFIQATYMPPEPVSPPQEPVHMEEHEEHHEKESDASAPSQSEGTASNKKLSDQEPNIPLTPGQAGPSWEDFVKAVSHRTPPLGAVLEHARLIKFDENGIVIGFEAKDFYASYLADPENKQKAEKLAGGYFQIESVPFKMVNDLKDVAFKPSLAEQRNTDQIDNERSIKEEAKNDPKVQKAVEILGASIKEIRPIRMG